MLLKKIYVNLSLGKWDKAFVTSLIIFETILSITIIKKVPYTEIDWIAYNEEVNCWKKGELNYMNIRGGTGPLVYPAGFLYLYRCIQYLAGGDGSDIYAAQKIFVGLYIFYVFIIMKLYMTVARKTAESMDSRNKVGQEKKNDEAQWISSRNIQSSHLIWSWRVAMLLCCVSKRVHSIFMLRLFNDAPAMILLYVSVFYFMKSRWKIGCVFFSLGVSIKMNVLLFAPGLLLLLLQANETLSDTFVCLSICASIQLILGAPFLLTYPVSYLKKAFEFDRVFFYKWTVNWKFLSEDVFVSKPLSVILLILHLLSLIGFAWKWLKESRTQTGYYIQIPGKRYLSPQYVVSTMFISNYIGICFSRTLHYQFYSWYHASIPFLLWCTDMWIPFRIIIIIVIEVAFNVFPATAPSSFLLQTSHVILLIYLMRMKVPSLYHEDGEKKPMIVMF